MKTLEFIFQETEIHFALQNDGAVMVNATEMAKAFGKPVDNFMRLKSTKEFIDHLESQLINKLVSAPSDVREQKQVIEVIQTTNRATFMHEVLALKFAAWLDVKFEIWVYTKIQDAVFGNYRKHWEAHADQEKAKHLMAHLKSKMLLNPTAEVVVAYFEAERDFKDAGNAKTKAIKGQIKLF